MADASQELMLRVRGDNSGADKAMAQTTRSIKGLSLSGQKAGGVFREFSRTLADAKSGADVAAGAADGLSRIIGRSLAGAVAVGAVKIFTDQIERMAASVKESATAAAKAFNDIENAGAAMSLAEAQSQVKGLEANIGSLQIKLDELDKSPFQNFIAKTTGARKSLEELQSSQQKLRDTELAAGMTSQNISEIKMASLDEEGKALEKINQEYRDRDKIASKMTDKSAQAQFQGESGDKFARDRNALLDKQAKARAELQIKLANMVADAEQKLADQAEARANKSLQERFDRINQQNNRIYKQEIYDIDEKSKMEASADDTKFKRELRNAYTLRAEQKKTQEDVKKAQGLTGGLLGASKGGQQAQDSARKRREQENKQANFKTQEAVFGKMTQEENIKRRAQGLGPITQQAMKERVATQQAAREAPSLADQIQGQATGVDPSQIASQLALQRFEKQATPFASGGLGGPKTGKLGEEAQTQTKEVMTAIQSLVDLMKSATLVN
jgi:hypothetical protein